MYDIKQRACGVFYLRIGIFLSIINFLVSVLLFYFCELCRLGRPRARRGRSRCQRYGSRCSGPRRPASNDGARCPAGSSPWHGPSAARSISPFFLDFCGAPDAPLSFMRFQAWDRRRAWAAGCHRRRECRRVLQADRRRECKDPQAPRAATLSNLASHVTLRCNAGMMGRGMPPPPGMQGPPGRGMPPPGEAAQCRRRSAPAPQVYTPSRTDGKLCAGMGPPPGMGRGMPPPPGMPPGMQVCLCLFSG